MRTIQQELDELADDFAALESWEDQLEYVIELGRALPPFPTSDQTEENKVRGCASQLWMTTERLPDHQLAFHADADAIISKGLAAVVLKLVSGKPAQEIAAFDLRAAFDRLGLPRLSMSRASGLASMAARVRAEALRASAS